MEACQILEEILKTAMNDIRKDGKEMQSHCISIDAMCNFVSCTSVQGYLEKRNPIVKTIVNSLRPNTDLMTRIQTVEQLTFLAMVIMWTVHQFGRLSVTPSQPPKL